MEPNKEKRRKFSRPCPLPMRERNLQGKVIDGAMKSWMAEQVIEGHQTLTEMSNMFNRDHKVVRKYVEQVQKGYILHISKGRPPAVSEMQLESLRLMHADPHIKMTEKVWKKKVIEARQKTLEERNQPQGGVLEVSRDILKVVETKLGVKKGTGQSTTEARAKACADVRNGVTFAAMNGLMVPNCEEFGWGSYRDLLRGVTSIYA